MILSPFAFVYGQVMALRNKAYDSKLLPIYKSKLMVISVGNITAGGSGKTPLCIFLANKFLTRGGKPVILSRGYGGTENGPIVVTKDMSASQVGDEPLLMSQNLKTPVVVSRDRIAGAKFIESENLGDLIILDDGFQHRRLDRDIDIVAVDVSSDGACQKFIKGEILPAGRFREARDAALKRADCVIFNCRGPKREIMAGISDVIPNETPQFISYLEGFSLTSLNGQKIETPKRAVAVCGLGNPGGFFSSIKAMGIELVREIAFNDHHVFSKAEIQSIREATNGLPLVISGKDRVRMSDNEWGEGVLVLDGELKIKNEDRLLDLLSNADKTGSHEHR